MSACQLGLAVVGPAVGVVLDVLEKRAAHGDVEQLVAAADREDGDVLLKRFVEEAHLLGVAVFVRLVGEGAALFAVELRVDVYAAHQEEALGVGGQVLVVHELAAGAGHLEASRGSSRCAPRWGLSSGGWR